MNNNTQHFWGTTYNITLESLGSLIDDASTITLQTDKYLYSGKPDDLDIYDNEMIVIDYQVGEILLLPFSDGTVSSTLMEGNYVKVNGENFEVKLQFLPFS